MNETNEIIKNKLVPALRGIMSHADVDPEIRLILDNGISATDELKQSVIDRYIAPFLKDDKNGQLKLLDEMLKATSDKEKLDMLKDFLEGIPVFSPKFDPKKFLEDTSEKIATGVPGIMPERAVTVGSEAPSQVEGKQEVDRNTRTAKELRLPPPQRMKIQDNGNEILPPPLLPIAIPDFHPRPPIESESYDDEEQGKQLKNAKTTTPEQGLQVPQTPTDARKIRTSRPAARSTEITTDQEQPKAKKRLLKFFTPIGVGVFTAGLCTAGGLCGFLGIGSGLF